MGCIEHLAGTFFDASVSISPEAMMTLRSAIASFLFLLLVFTIFLTAASRQRARASHSGNTQQSQVASLDNRRAGLEGRAAGFDSVIEASEVMDVADFGFMLGAAIVLAQILHRRLSPASVRPIVLDL